MAGLSPSSGCTDPTLYKMAKWAYQDFPQSVASGIQKVFGNSKFSKNLSGFIQSQLQSDFCHFTSIDIPGKFRALIAEPPKLPLLFLLYPATVGPRLYRAYQRGKENNDFREMGDVLRRDLTAITLFVFALGPLVNATNRLMQKWTGVNLLDPKTTKPVSYAQFENYTIDSGKALWQLVKEGNGEGLVNAVNQLNDGKLHTHGKSLTGLQTTLSELKTSVKALVDDFERHCAKLEPKQIEAIADKPWLLRAETIYNKSFEKAERQITEAINHPSRAVMEIGTRLRGQTRDVLKNYAKVRRLPSDIISFGMVIGLIGWFPVWFNSQWNKYQFDKNQKVKASNASQSATNVVSPVSSSALQPLQAVPASALPFSSTHSGYIQANAVTPAYQKGASAYPWGAANPFQSARMGSFYR